MNAVTLISFAGDRQGEAASWHERQLLLHRTALQYGGITGTRLWSWADIQGTRFFRDNQDLLEASRGCGYWLWKPFIILQTLAMVPEGEYVLYHDIGREFREGDSSRGGDANVGNVIELPVKPIVQWAEENGGIFPGVNIPHYGPASQWTKRDCFVGMNCDEERYWNFPLVQAGYNAWKNTPKVREFVETWLTLCSQRELISDDDNVLGQPNLDGFREHRHDQSILSNLLRLRGINVYGSLTSSKAYVRSFNYLVRRCALDAQEVKQSKTLTTTMQSAGGSWNLPVSVTTWVDLDFAVERVHRRRCMIIRDYPSAEEPILRSALGNAEWTVMDWSGNEWMLQSKTADKKEGIAEFDWVFAYGFRDQSKLVYAIRQFVPRLKAGGFMIAGLDHSEAESPETTFADCVRSMAGTRRLTPIEGSSDQAAIGLVIGMASNPVELKRRRGRPLVVSIQRGLPLA